MAKREKEEHEEHEEHEELEPIIGPEEGLPNGSGEVEEYEHLVWNLCFLNSNPASTVTPVGDGVTRYNYFYKEFTKTDVPSYREIWYHQIYPGVDARYYGLNSQTLKYDFVLASGDKMNQIRLKYEGVEKIELDYYRDWGTPLS